MVWKKGWCGSGHNESEVTALGYMFSRKFVIWTAREVWIEDVFVAWQYYI